LFFPELVMPVARIFTVHPERTVTLSKQLESEGYSVEIVRPESPHTPADLEIDFEVWPEQRALYRAAELAERLHADVCVAPGLDLNRPEPAKDQASSAQALPVEAQSPAATPATPSEVKTPAPELVHQEAATSAPTPGPPTEDISVPPAVWLAAAGPSRQPESISTEVTGREAGQTSGAEQPLADAPALITESPTIAEKARQALSTAWNAARELCREYKQRLDLRRAEFKAARQQRLLELEKRKAAAQERANELQAAREAASARLQELLRERGGEPAAPPASQTEAAIAPATPAQPSGLPAMSQSSLWRDALLSWLGSRRAPQTRAIVAGAAAVTALFALGLVFASFRSRPPLSNNVDHPNQGVTVKTGGVTLKPEAPAQTTPRPSPAIRSSRSVPAKASSARKAARVTETDFGDDVTVRHFTRSSKSGDVTIRHFGPQKPKPQAKSTPQGGLKHISDMDD
jgi:hypothetical protein